jgi:hypothetical protein
MEIVTLEDFGTSLDQGTDHPRICAAGSQIADDPRAWRSARQVTEERLSASAPKGDGASHVPPCEHFLDRIVEFRSADKAH